jgi:DnaJ-domain-containing protein 1
MAIRLRRQNIKFMRPAPPRFSLRPPQVRHAFYHRSHYIEFMPTLIAGVVAVILLYSLLQMFRAANPVVLARAIKIGGGVVALAVAAFTGIKGELAVAVPLGIFGAGLLGWSPFGASGFNIGGMFGGGGAQRSPGQSSRVRSQFLDMILDHDSGELSGQIVAGPYAGHSLGEFELSQLMAMISAFDAESVSLLESYLDRRFPAWRQDAQGHAAGGQSRSAASGKMTNEEAYQILGLQPGAGRDEIGRAHRALMKKLHPDQGGSTYLASRVNEAKDTLLRTHHS